MRINSQQRKCFMLPSLSILAGGLPSLTMVVATALVTLVGVFWLHLPLRFARQRGRPM